MICQQALDKRRNPLILLSVVTQFMSAKYHQISLHELFSDCPDKLWMIHPLSLLMCDKEVIEVQKILPFLSGVSRLRRIGRAFRLRASQSCRQSCNKSLCPVCGCRFRESPLTLNSSASALSATILYSVSMLLPMEFCMALTYCRMMSAVSILGYIKQGLRKALPNKISARTK